MDDLWSVIQSIGGRRDWGTQELVLAQNGFKLVQLLAERIRVGLRRQRLLRGILEDFVSGERIKWWEVVTLLAVLTANIDSLLFITLAQLAFESSQVARDCEKSR